METPFYKLTHILYFIFTYIVTLTCFLKYLLTHRNRSFDFRINNGMVSIECQIHHIKVISSINIANNWNSFHKYVRNCVPVPLHHPMNGTSWQGVDKFSHLIISTRRLLSRRSPYSIIETSTALISNMTNNNNSMSSTFFQFCCLFNNNLFVLQEFIFRKQTFCKCCSC